MKKTPTTVLMLLKKIPKGKVTTYKELARAAKTSPRAVGAILRNNKYPQRYPCYKVVRSSGEIGGYCGSAKKNVAKKVTLLRRDGIVVRRGKIGIKKYLYRFS